MAVRAGMATLIGRLRAKINDPAGSGQALSDQELQDLLDGRRRDFAMLGLEAVPAYPGGVLTYLEFAAEWSDWEDGVVLRDSSLAPVTPETSDLVAGRWTFAAEPPYPIYLTGRTYDLNGAAADALEQLAAAKATAFDFSSGGQTFQRSQQATALAAQAERYRRMARPQSGTLVREDIHPGGGRRDAPENWRR